MLSDCTIGSLKLSPPLFLAPMVGLTHSAFRRLVADFGGYGALFTEMLSSTALLGENLATSSYTKKRDSDGHLFYQVRFTGNEDIETGIKRLAAINPTALDINLGCPAPEIRKIGAGVELFKDFPRLEAVLQRVRKAWDGPLTIKCRLGADENGWQEGFRERLKLFEDNGVDGVFLHPRLFGEKLKRRARWQLFEDIAESTPLPLFANGDITSPEDLEKSPAHFGLVKGLMLGRIVACKPWIFREFAGEKMEIDYGDVWQRFYNYVLEDFPREKSLGRIKEFSVYYARNFFFGHTFFSAVMAAKGLEELQDKAMTFFAGNPQVCKNPSIVGI